MKRMNMTLACSVLALTASVGSTTRAAIVSNGAEFFYNAESLSNGDTVFTNTGEAAGTVNLGFTNSGTAVVTAPVTSTTISQAVVFDGTFFANNTSGILTNDETASIEVWFKPTDLVGQETLFESGGGSNGTGIGLSGADVVAASAPGGSSVSHTLTAQEITDFVQAVIVKDTPNNAFRLYINGALVDTDTASGDFAGADQTGLAGRSSGGQGPDGLFSGEIAFVRVYDTALSDAEVLSSFNTIVPEPVSLALIGLGVVCVVGGRRPSHKA